MNITTHETHGGVHVRTLASFRAGGLESGFKKSTAGGSSIHDLPWTPYTKERPPVVLLILDQGSASAVAIRRAVDVTDALRGTLHVALTIPEGAAGSAQMLVVPHVIDLLESVNPRLGYDLELVHDQITEVAADIVRETSPVLIVVDAQIGATEARRLVDRFECPVLVARDARPKGRLLAASDMSNSLFPVLERARNYARALNRAITYFHNAKPVTVFVADPMAGGMSYADMLQDQDDFAAAKAARLRSLAGRDGLIETVVARAGSTVDALLERAHECDADMIVVGHRPRSWLWRLLGRSTAEHIIGRSTCSVLVVPLDPKAS